MNQNKPDIQRKLRTLKYAEEIGSAVKTSRYFGVGRASFYRWKALYKISVKLDWSTSLFPRTRATEASNCAREEGLFVRRQINMDRLQPEGMEALAHLGFQFKRLACGDASV